jgi:hypothetical protein
MASWLGCIGCSLASLLSCLSPSLPSHYPTATPLYVRTQYPPGRGGAGDPLCPTVVPRPASGGPGRAQRDDGGFHGGCLLGSARRLTGTPAWSIDWCRASMLSCMHGQEACHCTQHYEFTTDLPPAPRFCTPTAAAGAGDSRLPGAAARAHRRRQQQQQRQWQ